MRKLLPLAVLTALVLELVGCGGSDSAFVAAPSGGGTNKTTAVSVTASAATIPSDGSASSTITAHATDANNAAVAGAAVTFSSSAGTVSGSPATTDANGNASAMLAAGTAPAGTAITVTATSGAASGTTKVTVSNAKQSLTLQTSSPQIPSDGSKPATITALVRDANNNFVSGATVQFTSTSGGLTVANGGVTDANGAVTATLSDAGDPSSRLITVTANIGNTTATVPVAVVGTGLSITGSQNLVLNGTGTYTVALTDASGAGIAGKTVALSASGAGSTLTPASVTTDSTGHATFTFKATSSGADTLTATALGQTATLAVTISSQSLVFTTPAANAKINLGQVATVSVTWTSAGVPQAGKTVTFAATRGNLSAASAVTNGAGVASVTISSATAGPAVISASGSGVAANLDVDFLATAPHSVTLQASPSTIPTQGQSTITATVRDINNNLVEGKTVDFSLNNDVTGGSLSVPSSVTNNQGKAQTVYTATGTTSARNGVIVDATIAGTPGASTTLTVGGQTVFLSLGTGNTITAPNATQYQLPYGVQAIDEAGNAIDGVPITLTVTSISYGKGVMQWNGTNYAPAYSTPSFCPSEDVNDNGILDPGEDFNGNNKLDPGLVASVSPVSVTTANGGSGQVNLLYPKDHAYWVSVTLTASATVQGTQSSTAASFVLPGLASDYNVQAVAPPGPISPYGTAGTCADFH